MKKATKKTATKAISKVSRKPKNITREVNKMGVGVYVSLALVVYVVVYFFLTSALKVIFPAFMVDTLWTNAQLISTAVLLTTFMSFGVLLFLTKSSLHKIIKVAGVCIMLSGFLYLYTLILSVLSSV